MIVLNRTSPLSLLALMIPFGLFGFGFLTTSLLFHRESDYALLMADGSLFASPAFSAGIVLFLRAIACGMISAFFALTTDPGAVGASLDGLLQAAATARLLLFAAMQLVPDLASEVQQMRLARAMKAGRRPRRLPGLVEALSLVIPLLAFAIRRAGRTAIAMEARGLSPDSARTIMRVPRFCPSDIIFICIALGTLGLCGVFCRIFRF